MQTSMRMPFIRAEYRLKSNHPSDMSERINPNRRSISLALL